MVVSNKERRAGSGTAAATPPSPDVQVIRPATRRHRPRDIARDAPTIRVLAARDFKVKYKQSLLGPLWLVFQPLALLGAFLVAFQGLADVSSSGVPYVLFALVGLSVWAFFQAAMTIGTASVVTNTSLVKYTPCPRHAFPIAAVVASLPSWAVTAAGAVVAAAVLGELSPRVLLMPLALVWLLAMTLGAVALTSALTVRYRDVNSALPFLLQVGMFFAPVGYALADLSSTLRLLIGFNPLTGAIEASRWMTLDGYHPSVEPILVSLAVTVALVVAGWMYFTRRETTMADEI